MAKNTLQLPKIDADALKDTEQYKQLVEALNKKPIDAYKQLIILRETSNPLTMAEGGDKLLDNMINSLNVNPQELEREFAPVTVPDTVNQMIDADPQDAYKKAYNLYHYTEGNTKTKLAQRQIYNITRNKLIEKGYDPDMVLNSNGVVQGLNFVGNLVSVPANLLAKMTAAAYGKSDKVKIWGGAGWEDTFKAINETPELQQLLRKKNQGIPLTYQEKQQLKDYDNKYAAIGTIFNIVADPTILLGLAGKGVGAVAKGGKWLAQGTKGSETLYKLGKFMESVGSPIKTYREMKYIKNLDTSGELANTVAGNLKTSVAELSPWLNKKQADSLTGLIDIEKISDLNINKGLKALGWLEQTAKTLGKDDIYNRIAKSNKLINDKLFEMNTIKGSKTFKKLDDVNQKMKRWMDGKVEKLGIRKAIISDVPIEAKGVVDQARRLHGSVIAKTSQIYSNIEKEIKGKLIPELKTNKTVADYMVKNGLDTNDVITELIEKEDLAKQLGIKNIEPIKKVNDLMKDYLIEEAVTTRGKIVPLGMTDKGVKIWKEAAQNLNRLRAENPFHSSVPKLEEAMRAVVPKTLGQIDDTALDMINNNVNYLTHIMTDDAKKIYLNLQREGMGDFYGGFRDIITSKSKLSRLLNGSAADINKSIKDGTLKTQIEKFVKDETVRLAGLAKPDKEALDRLKRIEGLAKVLDQFKGVKFFDTDLKRLISLRGSRSARTIQEQKFYDGIMPFGNAQRINPTDRKVNLPDLSHNFDGKFFPADIADAIEKLYTYTSNDRGIKKILNFMKEFQSFWKSTALSFYPSTVFRNMIGNIANSMLSVRNPGKLLLSFKDAFLALKNKDYEIVTETGRRIKLQDIYNKAKERGIFGTTFKQMEIDQMQEPTSIGGGIVSGAAGALGAAAKGIGNVPTAKMNDIAEGMSKLALYIEKIKEGKSFDDAANEVYKVLFDYGDLTEADRTIRNVVPFWNWIKKNFPLQLTNLLSEPSKALLKIEHSMNQSRPSEDTVDERYMSEWMQNAAKVQAGKNQKGQPQYILLEGLLPLFDLTRVVRAYTGGMQGIIDDTIKDMSPLVKTPIELATNRSFAFKKDIQKSPYETSSFLGYEISPKLKAVLDDWRPLSLLDKGVNLKNLIDKKGVSSTPEKDLKRMVFSWMFLNTQPYDLAYSRLVAQKDYETKLQSAIIGYKTWLSKLSKSMYKGAELSETDIKQIQNRGKQLFLLIQDGFSQGKIDNKKRGTYSNMLFKSFLQPAILPVTKGIIKAKQEKAEKEKNNGAA